MKKKFHSYFYVRFSLSEQDLKEDSKIASVVFLAGSNSITLTFLESCA